VAFALGAAALLTPPAAHPATAQPAAPSLIRPVPFPEPWGPFTPSVRTYVLEDRPQPGKGGTQEASRPLLVRLWYPSDGGGTPRAYMHPAVADAWRATLPAADGFETAVANHARVDAPLATARRRWPVLLFSHGRSFPVDNYQLCLEHLTSLGWVVAAISHPHEEALTVFPDGRRLAFAGPTWDEPEERGEVLTGVVDKLVGDAGRVLDHLENLEAGPSPFHGHLDLDRGVGYLGHSLGGAAAAWTLQRDPRVVAAASWEGQVYREEDRPLRPRGPLLYLVGGANRRELAGHHYRAGITGGPVFEAILEGAWHASFGDLLHVYRRYADADWLRRHRREMDPLRANQISNDLLHEFFSHALSGTPLDLLSPDSSDEDESPATWDYPEVELRVFANYGPTYPP